MFSSQRTTALLALSEPISFTFGFCFWKYSSGNILVTLERVVLSQSNLDADALGHQEADLLDYRPIQILKN